MVLNYSDDILLASAEAEFNRTSGFFVAPMLRGFCFEEDDSESSDDIIYDYGQFCYIFPITKNGQQKCLRIWKADHDKFRVQSIEHIKGLSDSFNKYNIQFVIGYSYIENAVRLQNGVILPAVLMDWVQGPNLLDYVRDNYTNSINIRKLASEFLNMCQYHHKYGMAHGDLSSKNIIVQPNNKICLIDYDTFYYWELEKPVPQITNGTPGFQHPERMNRKRMEQQYMNESTDYFSQLIIYFSLLVIAANSKLFNPDNDEGPILLSPSDIASKDAFLKSQIYKKISAIKNQEIQLYLKELVRAIGGPLSAVRSLVDVKKEIDAKLHPARPVEHVHPLPSIPTTRNYQVTCAKCGRTIQGTSVIKFCPYCGRQSFVNEIRYDVILKYAGANKLQVVKTIKEQTGLGLKESKDIVDAAPSIIITGVSKITAMTIQKALNGLGAEVELRQSNKEQSSSQPNNTTINTKPQAQVTTQQPKNIFKRFFLGISKLWDEAMGNIFTAFLACFSVGLIAIPSALIGTAAESVRCSKSGDKYFYGQEGQLQNYVQAVQEYKYIYPFITFNSKRTTNSTYNLATCYEYGLGTNKDSIQAFDRYLKVAKKGHIMAMNKVAQCYATGYGTIQSTEESSKWFEKSLRKGSAEELLEVGWQYEIGNRLRQNYAQAMKCYTTAAEKGLVAAQMKLGDCYLTGTCGAQKNTTDAAKWYQMAANQGDGEATEILQLLSNKPTSRDINRWYQTGCNYYHGNNGVKIDYAEAIKWHRKAALMGHADAQNYLGVCYDHGRGLNEDDVEAVKWYRKSAAQGYKYAQNNLGLCYAYGRGLNEDDIEAVKWYRKAAEQGHADAQNNLGDRLYNGQGIIKNYTEATKWFRKSAENGNQYAQYNLGRCYQYGQGVPKNLTEAKKWYQKAANQGCDKAKKRLVELNQ